MTTYYTDDHEWIRVEGDIATIGITAHAAEQLGEIVFVEMNAVGQNVAKGKECGTIESVKAASEIYAPVDGEITEVNDDLEANPALVNESPDDKAWLCKVKLADTSQLDGLMDKDAYDKLIAD
ncbi:MAG: glycine cleavage system protein GcvH [Geminicoccaceae bacterium]